MSRHHVDADGRMLLPSDEDLIAGRSSRSPACCNAIVKLPSSLFHSVVGSTKIDNRRRQSVVFILLALSVSSLLFVIVPYYVTTNSKIPDYISAFDYESMRYQTSTSPINGTPVLGVAGTLEEQEDEVGIEEELFPSDLLAISGANENNADHTLRKLQWLSSGIATSNAKLRLPSYPIFPKPQPILEPLPSNNDARATKVILLWTKLFGQADWRLGSMGREPFIKLECPISNCMVTDDRKFLKQADAVLINFRDDFSYSDRPAASDRLPNQLWTFVLWETPDHTYDWIWQTSHRHYRNLKDFSNFFNWTMTYRLDSDVRFHYGRFIPLVEPDFSRVGFDRLKNKSKTAVWMTSHCDTASHREILVKKLMNHIDIDTIGGCQASIPGLTNGICARPTHFSGSKNECLDHLSVTYKFYLSFENSLCRDYVTEKFYRAAKMDLIPVVLNGGDMSLFAPPHSYIDAQQFSTPAELAAFLIKVGSDPALYNSYFWWKPFYDVEQMWDQATYVKHFCDLCAKVTYASAFPSKSYPDIDSWWTTDGKCYEGRTSF